MRIPSPSRVLAALGAAAALAVLPATSALAAPVPAARAAATSSVCTVSSADLDWGFKESFRSYISGSIARGSWETIDGAGYETPQFRFTGGTGSMDPDTSTGEVSFAGGIVFSGHDGLLDTTVANPTLELTGPGTAVLRLDIAGVSMEEALAGGTEATVVEQVPFVRIDLAGATFSDDGALTATDAPTAITEEGYAAFPNYETGTAFDPITFSIASECAAAQPAEPAETAPAETASPAETEAPADAAPPAETGGSALPIVISSALFVVAGATVAAVVATRNRRKKAAEAAAPTDESAAGGDDR